MNIRTISIFAAMIVVVLMVFAGNVISSRSSSTTSIAQPTIAQETSYPISLNQASVIAQETATHATIIGTTMLTSYQGTNAYAVPMDAGTIYVEATTGRVLTNPMAVAVGISQHE